MRLEVNQAQKQKYLEEGMLVTEGLVDASTQAHLKTLSPGYNQFLTDPTVKKLLTKKMIGELLYQLTEVRPLKLIFSEVISKGEIDYQNYPFQGLVVVIAIPVSKDRLDVFAVNTSYVAEEKSLLGVYGINDTLFVNNKSGKSLVSLYKKMGYNQGDRLKTDHAPFVYK